MDGYCLAFYCSHEKLPWISRLKTTQTFYFTVLEARSLKWVSRAKVKGPAGLVPSWSPEDNLFPCLFQLLETAYIPWLLVSFHLQSQVWLVKSSSHCITLTLTSLPSPCTFKESCDDTGPTWVEPGYSPHLQLSSLAPSILLQLKFPSVILHNIFNPWGIKTGTSLDG